MRRFVALLVLIVGCSSEPALVEQPAPGTGDITDPGPGVVTTGSAAPTATPTAVVTRSTGPPAATTSLAPVVTTGPGGGPVITTEARGSWFVVWVTGELPADFASALAAVRGVDVVSVVSVGNAHVVETRETAGVVVDSTPRRFVIPVELHAIDPRGHAEFVPPGVAEALSALAGDEVLLGASSARLRRLDVGGSIALEDGRALRVAGVVDDRWIGAAEMVTTSPDASSLGADRARYAVVGFDGSRLALENAAGALTDSAVRVWAESDVPVLRHADAVAPQVRIKERFGEFSYRPRGGQSVEIDPAWVEANIVTVELPLIGAVRCHREFAELLSRVMEQLRDGGHEAIINSTSDHGCWNARFIAGRRDLSRHAWGVAADINWGNALDAPRSPTAPALLAAMDDFGITSGHDWINPDPGHFEWRGGRT